MHEKLLLKLLLLFSKAELGRSEPRVISAIQQTSNRQPSNK